MPDKRYREDVKTALDDMLLAIPGVKGRKMFGLPSYTIEGKVFACNYREGATVKLPDDAAADLLKREDVIPFEPFDSGKKMREWVQINRSRAEDYHQDEGIFLQALEYVLELAQTGG